MTVRAKRQLQSDTKWKMGERRQVGYVMCEIKGISQEGCAEGGSLNSMSCWGRDGWTTAALVKVREKGSVTNQAKMMGVGLQVLTVSRKYRKSGNFWLPVGLGNSPGNRCELKTWNLAAETQDPLLLAGREEGGLGKAGGSSPEDQGLPFNHVCQVLDLHPSECKQWLQSDSVAKLLFTAKTKKWQMNWGERAASSGRKYSFSNDLAVLLRVTAFQDRVSQQDT